MVTELPADSAASVTAWPHEGIVPLELWDVLVDGATLFARRDEPTFYTSLASSLAALRRGDAVREGGQRLVPRSWTVVSLVGGALREACARDAFDAAGIALGVVSDDAFFASSHAHAALGDAGTNAAVVDVGQTSIKASGPGGRIHRPRRVPRDAADQGRDAFAEEVAAALAAACPDGPPALLLLGLPCEVGVEPRGGDVILGASTYPTEGGGAALARDILARASFAGTPAALVNDAVLAAWALARRSPCQAVDELVLTIGLGVGAALLDRRAFGSTSVRA